MTSDVVARLNAALSGRYAIERELGAGGMATVYLARDLRHNRNVALKVLRPELAAVVGGERFLAEIETTANLKHPHILPLFDSGEADTFLFFVMPYIEGETLRDRLERDRQLPVDEALGIATSVAGALQHAHDRGVIHRDIKPGNILLQDGQPLVADFGIALAVGAAGGNRLTETGLSVGTPYYMSPEQATGDQAVGPASDTFALACVLYEMLVGEPPYPGSTAQAVLGKIIQGHPVSATAVRGSIPLHVDAAIRRALEKLPADRFTGAQDFAKALSDPSFRHGEGPESDAVRTRLLKRAAIAGWATAALAVAALAVSATREAPGPAPRVERFAVPFLPGQEPAYLFGAGFDLSPDGSMLVYRHDLDDGRQVLMMRRWDDLTATPIRETADGSDPAVSPDGLELAFEVDEEIRVLAFAGGPVRSLMRGSRPEWGPDGYVYASTDSGTARVRSTGGAVEPVSRLGEGEAQHVVYDVLPGGRYALVEVGEGFALKADEIRVLDVRTGEMSFVVQGGLPRYVPSGHLVFGTLRPGAAAVTLMAAPFDVRRRELIGAPVEVVSGAGAFSVADDGKLFYSTSTSVTAQSGPALRLAWVDPAGQASPVDSSWTFAHGANFDYAMSLSPDGSMVAHREWVDGGYDIWVKRLDTGPRWRVTSDEAHDKWPVWRPGTREITFVSDRGGSFDVWSKREDGTGEATLILDSGANLAQVAWSPDGTWLVVRTSDNPTTQDRGDVLALRPGIDSVPVPLLTSEAREVDPAVSPDGRWIAYAADYTGRYEVYVSPFPDVGDGRTLVSIDGGRVPRWAPGGEALYFKEPGGAGAMMRAETTAPGSGFVAGTPQVLFEPPALWAGSARHDGYSALAPDGARFLIAMWEVDPDDDDGTAVVELPSVILVNHFFEDLRARAGGR